MGREREVVPFVHIMGNWDHVHTPDIIIKGMWRSSSGKATDEDRLEALETVDTDFKQVA